MAIARRQRQDAAHCRTLDALGLGYIVVPGGCSMDVAGQVAYSAPWCPVPFIWSGTHDWQT